MGFKLFLLCNFLLKNQHLLSIADSDISVSVPHPQPPKCNGKLNRDIYSRMERRDIFHLEMSVVVFFFTSIFTCKFALLLRPCFILGKHLGGKFPASPCNYPGCMACSSLLPTAPKTVTTGTSLCICQLRMIKKEASRGPIYFFSYLKHLEITYHHAFGHTAWLFLCSFPSQLLSPLPSFPNGLMYAALGAALIPSLQSRHIANSH